MTAEPAGRAYTADEITVYFDSSRCRHFAECVRGAPSVFDVDKRPWIQPANGTADKIAEVVRRCPSGALHYRLAAGPAEVADVPTTVTVIQGGPILLRGDLELRGSFPQSAIPGWRCAYVPDRLGCRSAMLPAPTQPPDCAGLRRSDSEEQVEVAVRPGPGRRVSCQSCSGRTR